jgi:murein DD-endopeptidase MepM/ murein hydrolase activator NlpD
VARRGQLGGFSTSLFGSGTPDFSAFDILDPSHEAYLKFQKVQIEWDAGRVSNDTYIAALEVYANALPANSSDRASAQARLEETRYTVARNVLVEQVNTGKKSINDLLAFDNAKLIGLNPDSQEYLSKLNTLRSTQAEWIGRQEDEVVQRYSDGRMTTQQLVSWYMAAAANPQLANNPDLTASIAKRIHELDNRVLDERDSKMLSDFAAGKVTTSSFLAYAIAAKGRYAAGTTQAKDWDERIKAAKDNAGETNLLYRYGLSQQYAQLEQFVKSNAKPAGGSSSSTRVILGADGQWHTVTSTKTTAPTPAELEAWRKLQVEIADAKKQMVSIAKKIGGVGGFTSSQSVLKFYQDQLGKLAKGSADWYSLQQKIDNVNDRIHSETVLSGQGIAITYPGGTSGPAPSPSAAGAVNLDQFMRAIARQESGGRYDARNSQTGAYGKYQILPSNWPNWAQQAGLAGNAPQTPANQERVARFVFGKYEKSYGGDWSRVAAAWFAGVAGSANPSAWGPNTRRYVASINSMLGLSAVRSQPTTSPAVAAHGGFFVTGGHESQDFNDHHDGIDIAAKEGAPIYAVADGTVSYARDSTKDGNAGAHWAIGGGNTVNIDVGGGKTAQFAHMSRMAVAEGARVKKGQLIGYVGHTGNATGPHVHFGLWDHATNTMVDPTKYLGANWGQLGRIPGGQVVASHSLGAHTANSREGAQRAEALTMHVHQQLKSAGLNPVSATKAKPAAPAAPGAPAPAEKRGPLQVLDSVVRGPKGAIAVHSHSESFPPNLDGAAFERFFSNYERRSSRAPSRSPTPRAAAP